MTKSITLCHLELSCWLHLAMVNTVAESNTLTSNKCYMVEIEMMIKIAIHEVGKICDKGPALNRTKIPTKFHMDFGGFLTHKFFLNNVISLQSITLLCN